MYFLKLGGSLITDKNQPRTPRLDALKRLAEEIAAAWSRTPDMRIVLGHGSGSFGHTPALKYGTRAGVKTPEDWLGFVEVWKEARALNQIVVDALSSAGLPVVAFPPSAAVTASGGKVARWDISPIQSALQARLIPLVNGDAIFDDARGGTILSTEDLFIHLAGLLRPRRILLAGLEDGVWADYPLCTRLIPLITPSSFPGSAAQIGGSASTDVTGGMLEKVRSMLALVEELPGFQAVIFSGLHPGNVEGALSGATPGTVIQRDGDRVQ